MPKCLYKKIKRTMKWGKLFWPNFTVESLQKDVMRWETYDEVDLATLHNRILPAKGNKMRTYDEVDIGLTTSQSYPSTIT